MTTAALFLKQLDDITARRAAAGADADVREAGGSPEEAEAVAAALRHYLLGDMAGARRELGKVFRNGMVDRILAEFDRGAAAA